MRRTKLVACLYHHICQVERSGNHGSIGGQQDFGGTFRHRCHVFCDAEDSYLYSTAMRPSREHTY